MLKQYNTGENNISFSQSLLNAFDHYKFNCTGNLSNPTDKGHGPYCTMDDGQSLYDLRYSSFVFGKTHPLSLRAEQVNLDKKSEDYVKLIDQLKLKAFEVFKKTPDGIFSSTKEIFDFLNKNYSNLKILAFESAAKIKSDLNNLKENDNVVLHFSPQILVIEKHDLDSMFKRINEMELNIIVIEENLLGLTHHPFSFEKYLSSQPMMIFNNLSLDYFFSWNMNPYSSSNLNVTSITKMFYFLNFMQGIHFWAKDGRLQIIQNKIKHLLPKNINGVEVKGNFIVLNQQQLSINQNTLQSTGLLSIVTDQCIILRFPFSIKDAHIDEICAILKRHLRT